LSRVASNCQPQRPRSGCLGMGWGQSSGELPLLPSIVKEDGVLQAHRTRRAPPGPVECLHPSPEAFGRSSALHLRAALRARGPHPGRGPLSFTEWAITQCVRRAVLIPRCVGLLPEPSRSSRSAAGRRRASSRGGGRGRRPDLVSLNVTGRHAVRVRSRQSVSIPATHCMMSSGPRLVSDGSWLFGELERVGRVVGEPSGEKSSRRRAGLDLYEQASKPLEIRGEGRERCRGPWWHG